MLSGDGWGGVKGGGRGVAVISTLKIIQQMNCSRVKLYSFYLLSGSLYHSALQDLGLCWGGAIGRREGGVTGANESRYRCYEYLHPEL